MKLLQKQFEFAKLIPLLLAEAERLGFQYKFGEILRSQAEAERLAKLGLGSKNSVHKLSLAVDLLLFRDGIWQRDWDFNTSLEKFYAHKLRPKD